MRFTCKQGAQYIIFAPGQHGGKLFNITHQNTSSTPIYNAMKNTTKGTNTNEMTHQKRVRCRAIASAVRLRPPAYAVWRRWGGACHGRHLHAKIMSRGLCFDVKRSPLCAVCYLHSSSIAWFFVPFSSVYNTIFLPGKKHFSAERILLSLREWSTFLTRMKFIPVRSEVLSWQECNSFS